MNMAIEETPQLEYELLLCKAFKCSRSNDPLSLANTDLFYHGDEVSEYARIGIFAALRRVRNRLDDSSDDYKELMEMEDKVIEDRSHELSFYKEIMDRTHKIFEDNKY